MSEHVCTGSKAQRLAAAELISIGKGPRAAMGDGADHGSRRDFLALMGFSLGATALGACRAPVHHAIPLPIASPELVPGVARLYATTCGGCASACSVIVKQRDGRPIKVEGNPESVLFGGGTCATGQATVLSLYDSRRARGPTWAGKSTTWAEIDERIAGALAARPASQRVILLSNTITSPSTRALIAAWHRRYPQFQHIMYDPVSAGGLRQATQRLFGRAVLPHYRFDRARVVVALEADFLGTWLSPVEFARAHGELRRREPATSLHVQFESGLSVTGSNADLRIAVAPSELGLIATALLERVAQKAGVPKSTGVTAVVSEAHLETVAEALWQARGSSLVVSGSNDADVQVVALALNVLLGNVGGTVDVDSGSLQRQGDDGALAALIPRMRQGEIGALIIYGANPGYDHPDAPAFLEALDQVPLSVSLSDRADETSARVHAFCPDHHYLESWGDAEPVEGHLTLAQPLIAPLGATRAAPESLLSWLGTPTSHYAWIRAHWKAAILPRLGGKRTFETFWDEALQRGTVDLPRRRARRRVHVPEHDVQAAVSALAASAKGNDHGPPDGRCELHLFESVALRDGRHANNPWLQELPDPITRATWGNHALVAPSLARRMQLTTGDVVSLRASDREISLPVFIQAGQHQRTVSVALGYGRRAAGPVGDDVGANAFSLGLLMAGGRRHAARGLVITKTGRRELIATAQAHLSMEGRPIALTIDAGDLSAPAGHHPAGEHETAEALPTLWSPRPGGEHTWGLAVDLDACTGCSACVVACQAENNVPVIGKDQVQRNRIMHWLRIDRYIDGPEDATRSLHQPMMCQHCANAPCETVCPVLATTTSAEGLNQQVYNRCIGTRYCANNCPYKVRRFNWLDYTHGGPHAAHMNDPLGRMVLNPDVTVRTRGVMEKCSLCVQRIQLAKNQALVDRRALRDGDIETACAQSCPTRAITFGDLSDPGSRVSRLLAGPRAYRVLDELGTRPNVGYLKRVKRLAASTGEKR